MNPLEVLKEGKSQIEDFKLGINCCSGDYCVGDHNGRIKSHLTFLTIKLLESEIDRLKGTKKEYLKHIDPKGITNEDVDSYNKAIDDQISYLSAQLSEIKKI